MNWQAQIEQSVRAGELTVVQAQDVAAKLGVDPSSLVIPCEAPGCQQSMALGDAHSFLSVYATTGPAVTDRGHRVASFHCRHVQHYGCTVEHAAEAHAQCVREHLAPEHGRRADALRQPEPEYVPLAAQPARPAQPRRKASTRNG